MLSREDNEVLTRVGPGTPMGELMRCYWMPALLSSELPAPDCPPVRITLLGEKLVAFRDSSGAVGLLPEACPHRGASLFFGRNEKCGLRCVYHGWKFDVSGRCVDMPNEPAESNFKDRIRTRAYACEERNGVIWAYLGSPERKPGFPQLEWATVPAGQAYASKRLQECNWAQALEGGIDSSHVSFLHRDDDRDGAAELQRESLDNLYLMRDGAPKFELVPTEYGMLIGARRRAEEDTYYWRITQWLFPWYTMIPTSGDMSIGGHAWVPIDDQNVYTWSFNWHPARPLSERELTGMRAGRGLHMELIPGTFRGVSNRSNDYRIDRARQASGVSFTGIEGLGEQDACIQESMGPIFDRAQEHLGSTDAPIIQARRRLIAAATDLQRGIGPPALDPALYAVRSATLVLPREGVAWPEAAKEALTARPGRYVAPVYTV